MRGHWLDFAIANLAILAALAGMRKAEVPPTCAIVPAPMAGPGWSTPAGSLLTVTEDETPLCPGPNQPDYRMIRMTGGMAGRECRQHLS